MSHKIHDFIICTPADDEGLDHCKLCEFFIKSCSSNNSHEFADLTNSWPGDAQVTMKAIRAIHAARAIRSWRAMRDMRATRTTRAMRATRAISATDDALMMQWWCTDDVLMMHWWCADDALMMHWWCTDDALTIHWVWYDAQRSGFWPSLKVLWR